MKNRFGPDGMTFGSKIDTSNGHIEIFDTPLDDDGDEQEISWRNNPGGIGEDDKKFIKDFLKTPI